MMGSERWIQMGSDWFRRVQIGCDGLRWVEMGLDRLRWVLTSLKDRRTERPLTLAMPSSRRERETMMKSKMFQPSCNQIIDNHVNE